MKVLLTGGSGLLGSSISKLFSDSDLVTTFLHNKPKTQNSLKLDLSNTLDITNIIKKTKPDLIIHAAAATDIEWCETHRIESYKINSQATDIISKAANRISARVIYISTDFVFDGKKGNYKENDDTNPINVYGKTKLAGERFVLKYKGNLVIRTNIYGIDPFNTKLSFASFIVKNLREGKEIQVAEDQFYNPIFADQLSKYIAKYFQKSQTGIVNITCSDVTNRYKFCMDVCEIFNLDKALVKPVKLKQLSKNFGWMAKRPKNTSLNVDKAGEIFKLPTVKSSLKEYKIVFEGR